VSFFAFRCCRTASAKNLAKSSDNTPPLCLPQKRDLQEQLFQFLVLTRHGDLEKMRKIGVGK